MNGALDRKYATYVGVRGYEMGSLDWVEAVDFLNKLSYKFF